jgi:tetratricopeptide (TPR) repeat protein
VPASQSTAGDATGDRLASLERLLQSDPGNDHLLRECAALALRRRDFDLLTRITEARLRGEPTDALALAVRAQALIAAQEYRRAAEILESLVGAHPAEQAIRQDLALCHYCLGEYERARPLLEAAYGAGERSAGLLRLLVSSEHHLGRLPEAVAIADANSVPARADAALAGVYALLYLDESRSTDAAHWAGIALALDPECVDALTAQGTLAVTRGQAAEAQACFERALALAPATGRAWIGLGGIELLNQRLPQALEHLGRGVELMGSHVGSWHMLAWTYLLAGDLAGAEGAFEKALALNRNFAETHGGLGAVAALRGDTATAEREIETALRLDRRCLSAQFARSVLAGKDGDSGRARSIVLSAFSRLTADPAMAFARQFAARPPRSG